MLLVWLPLNGNLNNQGLADVTVTTTDTQWQTDGKIGSCLKLGVINKFTIPSMVGSKQMSFSYWVRVNTATSTNWLDSITWYSTDGNSSHTSRQEFYTNSTCTSVWYKGGSMDRFSGNVVGEWNHYVFTIDYEKGEANYYINGKKHGTTHTNVDTTHYLRGDFSFGQNGLDLSENDIRIYDHCLSPLEVKEISKTLVLHLPLDREGLGLPNLIRNSRLCSSTNDWAIGGNPGNCNLTVKDGFQCMHVAGELGTTAYLSPKYTIEADNAGFVPYNGMTITMSADVLLENVVKGTTNYFLAFYGSGQTIDGHWRGVSIVSCSEHFTSAKSSTFDPDKLNGVGWVRASVTFRYGDYAWTAHLRPNIYCRDFTGDFYVKNVKVEYGDKATPWCPNEADDLYTAYHCDDVIHDTSGYCYPAIGTNITYDSDTPRYQACAVLDGTSYIKIDTNEWMIQGAQALTWSIWGYSDDWSTETDGGRLISCTESGGFNLEGGASGYLRVPFYVFKDSEGSSRGYVYYNSSIQLASLAPGWHLFTTTYSTEAIKTYVDGVLTYSYSYTSYGIGFNKNARLFLGCEANTANPYTPYFKGKLADFRLYYTTLSAEDVYNLYAVGASLSDTGVLFSNEVSEV